MTTGTIGMIKARKSWFQAPPTLSDIVDGIGITLPMPSQFILDRCVADVEQRSTCIPDQRGKQGERAQSEREPEPIRRRAAFRHVIEDLTARRGQAHETRKHNRADQRQHGGA